MISTIGHENRLRLNNNFRHTMLLMGAVNIALLTILYIVC